MGGVTSVMPLIFIVIAFAESGGEGRLCTACIEVGYVSVTDTSEMCDTFTALFRYNGGYG